MLKAAVAYLTNYSVTTADQLVVDWRNFWMFLFSRYRDGFTTVLSDVPKCADGNKKDCTSRLIPKCQETGYSVRLTTLSRTPLATENLPGDTDGLLRLPLRRSEGDEAIHQRPLGAVAWCPLASADVRSSDDVIVFLKAEWYARVLAEGSNAAHYAAPAANNDAHAQWKMLRMDKKRQ